MRPISRVMLKAYGAQGINHICDSKLLSIMRSKKARAGKRKERIRNLRKADASFGNITEPERRAQEQSICSSWPARYAGNSESIVYANFAANHLDPYLVNQDRTQRTSAAKTYSLQEQISTLTMARSVLTRCSRIWSTVNQFIEVADVPGVNQAAISEAIQAFVCDLPATYTEISLLRIQREQELIAFHNDLVNGAEVGAMYRNSNTLMTELCERESITARVFDEIDEIKRTMHRLYEVICIAVSIYIQEHNHSNVELEMRLPAALPAVAVSLDASLSPGILVWKRTYDLVHLHMLRTLPCIGFLHHTVFVGLSFNGLTLPAADTTVHR